MIQARSLIARDGGQSLVEVALVLPLLLITLLGLVDVGRAYVYKTAVTNAAREGAFYAVKTPNATLANIAQRVCNETGFDAYNAAVTVGPGSATCASGVIVTSGTCLTGISGDVTVDVSFRFPLISSYIFQRALGTDTLVARGSACLRSLQ